MKYLLLFLCTTFIAITNVALAADIQVNITGIEKPDGFIRVALFPESKEEQFPQPVDVKQLATEAKTVGVSVVFKDISTGTYAISVVHDKNNNSKMDTFLGIPQEPYGNSGDYTSFKPNYEDSKFNVSNQNLSINIEVH
ncbi:MAG: hypothetical protein DRQ58_11870 [Gammaproteobacteria bacterium]|nr:MAG: hypothetical protein DRQ58_11870 [Gammaproteobacteria bacterium]